MFSAVRNHQVFFVFLHLKIEHAASKIWLVLFCLGFRYHGLHLDLQRVARLRLFRYGGSTKSIYSGAPTPVASLEAPRPSSRNGLLGAKLFCRTYVSCDPPRRRVRREANEMPSLSPRYCCSKTPVENNNVHITTSTW